MPAETKRKIIIRLKSTHIKCLKIKFATPKTFIQKDPIVTDKMPDKV